MVDGDSLRPAPPALSASGFGIAWFTLCGAFALYIFDEASIGFQGIYNPAVTALRESWSWFSVSPFEFREWLLGLTAACGLLACLTPVAARGMQGLRPVAWCFAVIMFFNGLAQTLVLILGPTIPSLRFPHPASGFYSSSFLLVASLALMVRLRRTARADFQLPTGD